MDCCKYCNVELTENNTNAQYRDKGWCICKQCFNSKYKKTSHESGIAGNPKRMYVNGKYISRKHPLYKPGKYKTFSDAAFDGTYKLESIKAVSYTHLTLPTKRIV